MPQFTSALVVASGPTDPVIPLVSRLAVAHRTTVTVADVMERAPAYLRPLLPREWNLPRQLRAQKTAALERSAARIRRLGIETRVALLEGTPVPALVREVARAGHDLLAIAASAPGEVRPAGTTAARLVRECPCPTLLVRPGRRRRHRVLVAIDPGHGGRGNAAMSASLLETGIAIAEAVEDELHVLHAWQVYDERHLRRHGLTGREMERFVRGAREEATEALERTIAPYRRHLPAGNIHLERGTPRKVIPAFAVKHRIELLVIGTVARSGLAGHLIGNTAEILLGQMPCSMLVVRPGRAARDE
jgi:nucleotide-binding universal stress UspA family protein